MNELASIPQKVGYRAPRGFGHGRGRGHVYGLLGALFLICFGCTEEGSGKVLRVTAIPDEAPNELLKKFEPLGRYLEATLGGGVKVEFTPVTDYPAAVEALLAGKADLVWYGGFTFVQTWRRSGKTVIPIAMREEDARFHSKLIAGAGSGIEKLEDLKARKVDFAFGSEGSTSGHLMPRYVLMQAGISPERDFGRVAYSGAHDATAKWVESGKVAAGALNESVLAKLFEQGKLDPAKVKVFYTTPPYVDYCWAARGDIEATFGAGFAERRKKAFLDLDPGKPEHKAILDLQRTKKYIPARAEDYAQIEEAARAAGLLRDAE